MIEIRTDSRREKIINVLNQRQPTLTLVLENIIDPHNVSAILRTCDAVGILEVHLVYTTNEFPEISKASSVSANKWVRTIKHKSYLECRDYLKERGFLIGASHLEKYSILHTEIDYCQPIALVFGNEHAGISEEFLNLCDFSFKIPMHGMIQSLNVSVAAGITLFQAEQQRRARGMYDNSQLKEEEYNSILKEWLLK